METQRVRFLSLFPAGKDFFFDMGKNRKNILHNYSRDCIIISILFLKFLLESTFVV